MDGDTVLTDTDQEQDVAASGQHEKPRHWGFLSPGQPEALGLDIENDEPIEGIRYTETTSTTDVLEWNLQEESLQRSGSITILP